MGDETSASSVKNIFAAFLPVILRFHVPGYFVDFQFADLLTFWNAMILEELAVGEDQRAILFGGEDTLLCVVDGMCQRVDIVSVTLYVGDVLDVPFDVAATVRQLFAQIGLQAHVVDLSGNADAVADALLVGTFLVFAAPVGEVQAVFFDNKLLVVVKRDTSGGLFA